jgi:hypothetical protein
MTTTRLALLLCCAIAGGCTEAATPTIAPDGRTAFVKDQEVDCAAAERVQLMSDADREATGWLLFTDQCSEDSKLIDVGDAPCHSGGFPGAIPFTFSDPYGGGRGCFMQGGWPYTVRGHCYWISCQ